MLIGAARAAGRTLRGWFVGSGQEAIQTPANETAMFELQLGDLTIGRLGLHAGMWEFKYSPAFVAQLGDRASVQPLVDFPDVSKTYSSPTLWPFFAARIPSAAQPRVLEEIERQGLDQTNASQLLRAFGERSIANPFLLRSA